MAILFLFLFVKKKARSCLSLSGAQRAKSKGRFDFGLRPSLSGRAKPVRFRLLWLITPLVAVAVSAVLSLAPALARESTQDDLTLGAQLYAENCAVCHGPTGEGRIGATLAKDWPSIQPDAEIRTTIVNGIPGSPMPAWSQAKGGPLSEGEIDALVAYILSWQTGGGQEFVLPTPTAHPPITPVPDVAGDPNRGIVLYDQNCKVCHGQNGEGRIGAQLSKDWPSIRPDLAIRQAISAGISGSPMPAWSQANGGPLTVEEIDDLVAYVLTWSTAPEQVEPTAIPSPTPVPEAPAGVSTTGLIIGAVILVILIIAGVVLATRKNKTGQ